MRKPFSSRTLLPLLVTIVLFASLLPISELSQTELRNSSEESQDQITEDSSFEFEGDYYRGRIVRSDGTGGWYLAGDFYGTLTHGAFSVTSIGDSDVFLAHIESDGTLDWLISGGGEFGDSIYGIDVNLDGDLVLCAEYDRETSYGEFSASGNYVNLVIVKVSSEGDWLWMYSHASTGEERPRNLAFKPDDSVLVLADAINRQSHDPQRNVRLIELTPQGEFDQASWIALNVGNNDQGMGIDVDENGTMVIAGFYQSRIQLGNHELTNDGKRDLFVASRSSDGEWIWLATQTGTGETGPDVRIVFRPDGNILVSGNMDGYADFNGTSTGLNSSGKYLFIGLISIEGSWLWVQEADGSGGDYPKDLAVDKLNRGYMVGLYQTDLNFSKISISSNSSGNSAFIAQISDSGEWLWAESREGVARSITTNKAGNSFTTGYTISDSWNMQGWAVTHFLDLDGDGIGDFEDNCPYIINSNQSNHDSDSLGDLCDDDIDNDRREYPSDFCPYGLINWDSLNPSLDYDQDGCSDIEDLDGDNDTVLNILDSCTYGVLNWISNTSTDYDSDGCRDDDEDLDDDSDLIEDSIDDCPRGMKEWYSNSETDWDGDGCNDIAEDEDDDSDTILDAFDRCPKGEIGWISTTETDADADGCPGPYPEDHDLDQDGYPDVDDTCPTIYGNSSQSGVLGCLDYDGDGWADQIDAFTEDSTQWSDYDKDGYGDNRSGTNPDNCPHQPGSDQGCPLVEKEETVLEPDQELIMVLTTGVILIGLGVVLVSILTSRPKDKIG